MTFSFLPLLSSLMIIIIEEARNSSSGGYCVKLKGESLEGKVGIATHIEGMMMSVYFS